MSMNFFDSKEHQLIELKIITLIVQTTVYKYLYFYMKIKNTIN